MANKGLTTKALVFGATGYVGRQVVRRLCEKQVETIAHLRPDSGRMASRQEHFTEYGATPITVPWNATAIGETLATQRPTHVFSLIGTTRAQAKSDAIPGDIYQAVDYRLTKLALDACTALETPPRFIYLSSVGASSKSRSAYLRARGQIEEQLQAGNLSWLSAQPSIITGHDRDVDRPAERWGAAIGDRLLRVASLFGARGLKERYVSTSATRLAEALVTLGLSGQEGVRGGASLRLD